jgi:uncharacterized protein (TIGR03067 family)
LLRVGAAGLLGAGVLLAGWVVWPRLGRPAEDGPQGPERPYFQGAGVVSLQAGRPAETVVSVARRTTREELTVAVSGLPAGVTCLPGQLPPGSGPAGVRLRWRTSPDAAAFAGRVTLHLLAGDEALDEKRVSLHVTPFARPRLAKGALGEVVVEPGKSRLVLVRVDARGNTDPWELQVGPLPEGVRQGPPAAGRVPAGMAGVELRADSAAPKKERLQTQLTLSADGVVADSAPLVVTVARPRPTQVVVLTVPAGVRLDAGGRARVAVGVRRVGYPGPVRLDVEGLPAGVRSSGAEVPADADVGQVELQAGAGAEEGTRRLRIVARIDGRELGRQDGTFVVGRPPVAARPEVRPGEAEAADDLKKLQGSWRMQVIRNGKPVVKGVPAMRVVIRGDVWTQYVTHKGKPETKTPPYSIVLDARKAPRWIDLQRKRGVLEKRGVYAIEGDTVRVVLAGRVGDRLESFSRVPPGATVMTLTRDESGK